MCRAPLEDPNPGGAQWGRLRLRHKLTRQVLVSSRLLPPPSRLQQLVPQGVLLFGFVGVQPAGWFGVGWVGHEGVGRVNGASPVAVDAEAALPRDLDQLGGGAGRGRQRHVAGAKGRAADGPVDAGALVLAAGLEVLAVLVNAAAVFTGAALCLRWGAKTTRSPTKTGAGAGGANLGVPLLTRQVVVHQPLNKPAGDVVTRTRTETR